MRSEKHLSFGSLRKGLSSFFERLSDNRQQGKVDYSIHDAMMSGFACMYFQDPSLLQFQKRLKEEKNRDNLQTLFGVSDIPEETQMRDIIDEVESRQLRPIFKEFFHRYCESPLASLGLPDAYPDALWMPAIPCESK